MSMDDDLFNVPDNEEEMLDGNDEGEDMDEQDVMGDGYDEGEDAEDDNMDEDGEDGEEGEDEEDEDDDDNEEGDGDGDAARDAGGDRDGDEDDEDDEDEGEEDGDDDIEDEENDDSKFMDAQENNDGVVDLDQAINERKEKNGNLLVEEEDDTQGRDEDEDDMAVDKEVEDTQEDVHEDRSPSAPPLREQLITRAKVTDKFDITPSVAIPYTSQCYCLALTDGPKWILTGGEDGFIRKYDFIASIDGKSPLTMAQKHNLVDSITKAGVISSYWENEQILTRNQLLASNSKIKASDFTSGNTTYEPKVNPVYALDVERNGYWCLSGTSTGGISLYTMRHNEGVIHHYFMHDNRRAPKNIGHYDAISTLKLNTQQDKFLSGSWDKSIREWDLNTGKQVSLFGGSSGQISNIQYRPLGLTDLSLSISDEDYTSAKEENDVKEENKSEIDSLFGDSDEEKGLEKQDKTPAKINIDSSKVSNKTYSNDSIFMSSSIDGTINVWDLRTSDPVLRLGVSEGIPPWCMSSSWSNCGDYIYAGRRNSTVEEFSIKMPHTRAKAGHHKSTMVPNVSKLLQFPKISGPVSAISVMPNNNFLLCGSNDNIRLYNLNLYNDLSNGSTNNKKPATPFMIIPGHHGGILSCLYVDETGRFMVSASGNRGWGHSAFTESVLIYEIDFDN